MLCVKFFRLLPSLTGYAYKDTVNVSAIYYQTGAVTTGNYNPIRGKYYQYTELKEDIIDGRKVSYPIETRVKVSKVDYNNPLYEMFQIPANFLTQYNLCVTNVHQYKGTIEVFPPTDRYIVTMNDSPDIQLLYSDAELFSYPYCIPISQTGTILSFKLFFNPFFTMNNPEMLNKTPIYSKADIIIVPKYKETPWIIYLGTFSIIGSFFLLVAHLSSLSIRREILSYRSA